MLVSNGIEALWKTNNCIFTCMLNKFNHDINEVVITIIKFSMFNCENKKKYNVVYIYKIKTINTNQYQTGLRLDNHALDYYKHRGFERLYLF